MEKPHYEPPKQSAFGQFFDSLFLMASLFSGAVRAALPEACRWRQNRTSDCRQDDLGGLGQSAVQQAQWEKLGLHARYASSIIASRFDYSFNVDGARRHGRRRDRLFRASVRVFEASNIAKSSPNVSANE